ncbi:hypothetical protein I4I78_27590, partial [Pseudonocardia sp. KRD-291]|nr:hypothetical protein [Pseudonocardia sp. KRD291]
MVPAPTAQVERFEDECDDELDEDDGVDVGAAELVVVDGGGVVGVGSSGSPSPPPGG